MKHSNKQKGSALAVVIILTAATAMVLATLSNYTITEKKLNADAQLLAEAQNAAESIVEYGFAELEKRFEQYSSFPTDNLFPVSGANPIELPQEWYDLHNTNTGSLGRNTTTSKITLPPNPYDPFADWDAYETQLIAGAIQDGEWTVIKSTTPGNEFDILSEQPAIVRHIKLLSKATVTGQSGRKLTAYCMQELQVRDAIISEAIFYNLLMEIAPGPAMTIKGPTHANGHMYIQANASLDFMAQVTATGELKHGTNERINKSVSNGTVTFKTTDGSQASMYDGGWIDSTSDDWRSEASNKWGGNVQDSSHGVSTRTPVAIDDYVADDPSTSTVDDQLNYAYQLIMPTLNSNDSKYNSEIEQQKFAYSAGLTIEVDTSNMTHKYYTYQRDANNNILYDSSGNPKTTELVPVNDEIVDIESYSSTNGTGLYDKRRGEQVKLVSIKVDKLKHYVEDLGKDEWGGDDNQAPQEWWNGVVYVKFPYDSSESYGTDGVRPSVDDWGVQLKNGSDIPNPSFAHTDNIYGTTIATNNVVYVNGNYNADGSSSTGSATEPDNTDEPPAAIVGDAVNILSNNWNATKSSKSMSNRIASSFTEVSAIIMTGLTPSDKNNNGRYSGGVENFPRFLEKWSNKTLRYRGSMIAYFESEVATEPWGSSDVYSAPKRDWGYNSLYSTGKISSGFSTNRDYKRVNFKYLTKTEWDAEIEELENSMSEI